MRGYASTMRNECSEYKLPSYQTTNQINTMQISTIQKAFSAIESAAQAANDICYEMTSHETVIAKSIRAKDSAESVFSNRYITLDELEDTQKNWLENSDNYVFPTLPWKVRDFIRDGVNYYVGKPGRDKEDDCLRLRIKDLKAAIEDHQRDIEHKDKRIAELETDNHVLDDRNSNQTSMIDERDATIKNLQEEMETLRGLKEQSDRTVEQLTGNIQGYQSDIEGQSKTLSEASDELTHYKGYAKYVEEWLHDNSVEKDDLETYDEWCQI